jgi:hypothetical protein
MQDAYGLPTLTLLGKGTAPFVLAIFQGRVSRDTQTGVGLRRVEQALHDLGLHGHGAWGCRAVNTQTRSSRRNEPSDTTRFTRREATMSSMDAYSSAGPPGSRARSRHLLSLESPW